MNPGTGSSLIVLGWHNVHHTPCFPFRTEVGRRGLTAQFRALKATANVVSLTDALAALAAGRPLPPRAVAITFDDGYTDNLTFAGPLLARMGLPATCFLVPGLLSRDVEPWWEVVSHAFAAATVAPELVGRDVWSMGPLSGPEGGPIPSAEACERLKRLDQAGREAAIVELQELLRPATSYRADDHFLDWEGARELTRFMEIGSHSMRHTILANETADEQVEDLGRARRTLQDKLSVDASVLAYPNGGTADYSAATIEAAELAGHTAAITTRPGRTTAATPPFEIRRWLMRPDWNVVDLTKILRDVWVRRI